MTLTSGNDVEANEEFEISVKAEGFSSLRYVTCSVYGPNSQRWFSFDFSNTSYCKLWVCISVSLLDAYSTLSGPIFLKLVIYSLNRGRFNRKGRLLSPGSLRVCESRFLLLKLHRCNNISRKCVADVHSHMEFALYVIHISFFSFRNFCGWKFGFICLLFSAYVCNGCIFLNTQNTKILRIIFFIKLIWSQYYTFTETKILGHNKQNQK